MRIESSVTSMSWIPSEAIEGMGKLAFGVGMVHYDLPPPEQIDDLEALRQADRFRFANELRAWIEVEGGEIVGYRHSGRGHMGSTRVRIGGEITFPAVAFPDLSPPPDVDPTSVMFVQTTGGRAALPAPRRVRHAPFVQWGAPSVWTTLALTIHSDGTVERQVLGTSTFPRHWIYDHSGQLVEKSGLMDFSSWWRRSFGKHTPWGDEESPALVTEVESALERELSATIMRGGARPKVRRLKEGRVLVEQGQPGEELFLLLDGVLSVEVDSRLVAEVGPGAVLGERALLEGGRRTSTLRAVTPCKVAVARKFEIDPAALSEVSSGHRREHR